MYNFNKLTSLIYIISSITFLSACGGNSEDTETYTTPKVMSEVKTDLKFVHKVLPSSQSTTVDQPVYRFIQIFNKENNQFKTSYQLQFDFNIDVKTLYRLEANYDQIINSTPNSIKLMQFEKSGKELTYTGEFYCSKKDNPCPTLINSINIKTGKAKLNFNNLLLTKSSWMDGQLNTITLAGYVEGTLTEAPTKVQLPTSQAHQLIWTPSLLTTSDSAYLSLPTQYEQLIFTNHNDVSIRTSYNKGVLENLVTGSTSIYIHNNKVNGVYINFPNSPDYYYTTCSTATLSCEGTTYNPVNYQVTFDNTKVQSIFWGNNIDIGYLNGSAGL
ncbi:hypothetical protein [Acinetobacter modestus]|uniref:hypothetical protein n=1 Tax=Acinetobacter modestus TaxID=1776740 RepID=UPI001F4AE3E8|nr:hypothetical protein [Acinetobacter modestus]MCH7333614.1 hypothetical protein [Acinetobacter modestus]